MSALLNHWSGLYPWTFEWKFYSILLLIVIFSTIYIVFSFISFVKFAWWIVSIRKIDPLPSFLIHMSTHGFTILFCANNFTIKILTSFSTRIHFFVAFIVNEFIPISWPNWIRLCSTCWPNWIRFCSTRWPLNQPMFKRNMFMKSNSTEREKPLHLLNKVSDACRPSNVILLKVWEVSWWLISKILLNHRVHRVVM